jgi:hypothetical protein
MVVRGCSVVIMVVWYDLFHRAVFLYAPSTAEPALKFELQVPRCALRCGGPGRRPCRVMPVSRCTVSATIRLGRSHAVRGCALAFRCCTHWPSTIWPPSSPLCSRRAKAG